MAKTSKKMGVMGIVVSVILAALIIAISVGAAKANSSITLWWSSFSETGNSALPEDVTRETLVEDMEDISTRVMSEGAVLLENEGALPLAKNTTVNLFGYYGVNALVSTGGSVSVGSTNISSVTLKEGLEAAGLKVNEELYEVQEEMTEDSRYQNIFSMVDSYEIAEYQPSDLQALMGDAAEVSDVAIYVMGRNAGEKNDPVTSDAVFENGEMKSGGWGGTADGKQEEGAHYLQFTDTEKQILMDLNDNFDKVIVLLNLSTPMELGAFEDPEVKPDAVLYMGTTGTYGALGVGKVLVGDENPSGKLSATYAYDVTDTPAFYTYGTNVYANASEWMDLSEWQSDNVKSLDSNIDKYYHYYEGIYVGYKYYETRYIGDDNVYTAEEEAAYQAAVQYPFGYGLSYTDFEWSNARWEIGGKGGKISVTVDVKNTGDVAGKDVVQLYYTAPYTPGGVEKSAVELAGYVKTDKIEPGATDTVTITMNYDDMASYDYKTEKCYILDAGTYTLSLRSDAHTVKDGLTETFEISNKIVYRDDADGKRSTDLAHAVNQFDELNEGDGSITYVSRADWEGTMPTQRDCEKTVNASQAVVDAIKNEVHGSYVDGPDKDEENAEANGWTEDIVTNADNGLTVDQFAGMTDYDDPLWDDLLDQLSIEDMRTLYTDGAYRVASVAAIGMNLTVDADSGVGLNATSISQYGVKAPSPQIWAGTFNDALIEELAKYLGYDFLLAGAVGVYGPSCNLMRTPFNGRNGEYMSEDSLLTGKITAAYDRGIQGVGCYVYNKHYAVYGCAGNASAMVWLNEQALRETYLRHFEIAVKEGGAKGMMVSFAKIGTSLNTCTYPLLTTLPREEWGFQGAFVSDGISTEAWNQDLGLLAGLDLVLDASVDSGMTAYEDAVVSDRITDSIYGRHMMRESAKRLIYRYCNSAASTAKRDFTPTWIIFVVLLNVILAAGIVCCIIFLIKPAFFPKKEN